MSADVDQLVLHGSKACRCGGRLVFAQVRHGIPQRIDEARWTCVKVALGFEPQTPSSSHAIGTRIG